MLRDDCARQFFELLRAVLRSFDPVHTGVDVAVVFLAQLPPAEAVPLLRERRQIVAAHRAQVAAELGDLTVGTVWSTIAADHLFCLIDAEQAWLDRALVRLHAPGSGADDAAHAEPPEAPGHSS